MTTFRSLAAIRGNIHAEWPEILRRSGVTPGTTLPASPTLLGSGTKTEKGSKLGILTAVVYMAPATAAFKWSATSKRTTCPRAGSCALVCLGEHAGRLAHSPARNAQAWKTALFFGARDLFRELLLAEALAFACYDYTKIPARAIRWARGGYTPNYSVTFSRGGDNDADVALVLAAGGNVAAVFSNNPRKAEPLPASFDGVPVVSGDETDARFLDEARGAYIGLGFKQATGRASALAGSIAAGFVISMADPRVATIAPENALQAA